MDRSTRLEPNFSFASRTASLAVSVLLSFPLYRPVANVVDIFNHPIVSLLITFILDRKLQHPLFPVGSMSFKSV